jgi:hypothetical protein
MDPTEYIVPPIYSFKSQYFMIQRFKSTEIQLTHPTYMQFHYLNGTIDEDPPIAYLRTVEWYDNQFYDWGNFKSTEMVR